LEAGALTLAAEDCEDPPVARAQGKVVLRSVVYYPEGCLCVDNAACIGDEPYVCKHVLGEDLPHSGCSPAGGRCAGICRPVVGGCGELD
jgi:hypothetical protein